MRSILLFLLLLSYSTSAADCVDIWPRAVTENTAVPASVSYSPSNPTAINNFSGQFGPGDYSIGTHSVPNGTVLTTTGATTRIFVNGDLVLNNNVLLNSGGAPENLLIVVTGSLSVYNNSVIRGFVLVGGAVFFSNNASINGGLTARGNISGRNNSNATYNPDALSRLDGGVVCGLALSCFNDNFQNSSLSPADWVVSRSSGNYSPTLNNGRLRMTQAVGNQSTAASFQRLFPGQDNLVVVEFDHFAYGRTSSEGADGMAVVLSDASITPQPGAFGGPLGYGIKPGIPGFAGGWLGIGLDEFGNFSGEGGSTSSPGQRRQSVALRGSGSGSTGYRYLAGTCSNGTTNTNSACLSPTVDNNNVSPAHRYRVTVDSRVSGQAMVKVERRVSGTYEPLINNFNALNATGQAPVPANFILSVTGSTGGSNNVHEMDNVQICALKTSPVGEQIDHFEFTYSGQALTCKDEVFTIKACKNAACTELVTSQVSATLTPTSGWVSGSGLVGNVLTFSGGTATATLRQNTPITVKVGVSGSTPLTKPLSTTLCQIGASLSAANCDVVFSDSGFVFDVPDKLAAKPANGIVVKAVKKGDGQQCVPSFANVSRVVRFWADYVNPIVPAAIPAQAVTVIHNTTSRAVGSSFAAGSDLTLDFNAQGQATISVNYADAGQLRLNARYTGSATNQDTGRVLDGADLFVSSPVGLCLQAPVHCAVANENCTVMTKAATPFNVTFSARAWQNDTDSDYCDNGTTPSFTLSNIQLIHSVLVPSTAVGGINGSLTPASYTHQAVASASTTVSAKLNEVGVFNLKVNDTVPRNYLGTALDLKSTMPNAVNALGRLVPAGFVLDNNSLLPGCGTFSYMNQPAALNFRLRALNQDSNLTQNYRDVVAKATAMLVAESNNDAVERNSRLVSNTLLSWNGGVATQNAFPVTFSRLPVPATTPSVALPDGPVQQLIIGMKLQDNDNNNTVLADLDLNTTTSGNCVADLNCTAKALGAAQDVRYGRVQLVNAIGSEQSDLPVQLKAEFYNGSQFVPNDADSCSPVEPGRLLVSPALTASGSNNTLKLGVSLPFDLWLPAPTPVPTSPRRYSLIYNLDSHPWLKYDWDPANGSVLENPKAEAVFGGFRGNNRQIFWREN